MPARPPRRRTAGGNIHALQEDPGWRRALPDHAAAGGSRGSRGSAAVLPAAGPDVPAALPAGPDLPAVPAGARLPAGTHRPVRPALPVRAAPRLPAAPRPVRAAHRPAVGGGPLPAGLGPPAVLDARAAARLVEADRLCVCACPLRPAVGARSLRVRAAVGVGAVRARPPLGPPLAGPQLLAARRGPGR